MAETIQRWWQKETGDWFSQLFSEWMNRRLPKAHSTTLNQKRIFIVPSKLSLGLLALVLLLFILASNFQNSLIYAISFWLLAFLLINIFYTYRNLSSLSITAIRAEPCFAGEKSVIEFDISCPESQKKFALKFSWPDEDQLEINLIDTNSTRISLSHSTHLRGYFQPPRIRVSTRYPTGMAVAWSYVLMDIQGLVYPRPVHNDVNLDNDQGGDESEDGAEIANGTTDFSGIRDYRAGDAPKRIHWNQYAKTGALYTKNFVDYASHDRWLDWESLKTPGIEIRLSHLCSKVLAFHQKQYQYGLKLPGKTIAPGQGDVHRDQCLRALALFGMEKSSE